MKKFFGKYNKELIIAFFIAIALTIVIDSEREVESNAMDVVHETSCIVFEQIEPAEQVQDEMTEISEIEVDQEPDEGIVEYWIDFIEENETYELYIPEDSFEEEPELISLGEFKLTAYCSCEKCCGKWAKNRPVDDEGNQIVIGASGAVLAAGTSIAVDPKVIPYGTKVIINDHEYTAQDCGGAIKQNRIDVYFDDHKEADDFGVQYAEIFIEAKGGE